MREREEKAISANTNLNQTGTLKLPLPKLCSLRELTFEFSDSAFFVVVVVVVVVVEEA